MGGDLDHSAIVLNLAKIQVHNLILYRTKVYKLPDNIFHYTLFMSAIFVIIFIIIICFGIWLDIRSELFNRFLIYKLLN